jgi:deazaflavin-dependent oxidoreductase (nitroreductase family)
MEGARYPALMPLLDKEPAMPKPNESLNDRLATTRQAEITVTGRKSGRAITVTIWFVLEGEKLYLLPVNGSDTQWYQNVLANSSIRISSGTRHADLRVVPLTEPAQVSSVIEKFRAKYGDSGMKYYSKLDVALVAAAP